MAYTALDTTSMAATVVRVPRVGLGPSDQIHQLVASLYPYWTVSGVALDFSGCSFLAAEAVAVLAGFTWFRGSRGLQTQLLVDSMSAGVRKNLWKMGFLELFGGHPCSYPDNSLPLYRQDLRYDGPDIMKYIKREVMSRPEMPMMSKGLSKEIRRSFVEIFGNVFYHSRSAIGGLVCGQVYPNRKEIQLTFFDAGVGIGAKVRAHVKGIPDDPAAIRWALERGTSTLAISEGHPRGLGLYLLRQFLKLNGGELRVYANGGCYRECRDQNRAVVFDPPLNGTLMDLRIRVEKGVSYRLSDEAEDVT